MQARTEKEKKTMIGSRVSMKFSEILAGKFEFKGSLEDVAYEYRIALIELIGEAGKKASYRPKPKRSGCPLTCGSGLESRPG